MSNQSASFFASKAPELTLTCSTASQLNRHDGQLTAASSSPDEGELLGAHKTMDKISMKRPEDDDEVDDADIDEDDDLDDDDLEDDDDLDDDDEDDDLEDELSDLEDDDDLDEEEEDGDLRSSARPAVCG